MSRVRVVARLKPGCDIGEVVDQLGDGRLRHVESKSEFQFDHVLGPETSQQQVFDLLGAEAVSEAIKGYNYMIFAYGQSGSGKTHSMVGKKDSETTMGLIPRIARELFKARTRNSVFASSSSSSSTGVAAPSSSAASVPMSASAPIDVTMYLFEIYKEVMYDLVDERTDPLGKMDVGRVFVDMGGMALDDDVDGFMAVFEQCIQNRKVASTNWNEESTRSHVVCVFDVEFRDTRGRIFCVDLSGSENVKESGAEGTTLREAQAINLSLFHLSEVVRAYDAKKQGTGYRNSVLTHLLKDAFGGNAKVSFLVTLRENSEETRRTLEFAKSLCRIQNRVRVNLNLSMEQWRDKFIDMEKRWQALKAENEVLRDCLTRNKIPLPRMIAVASSSPAASSSSSEPVLNIESGYSSVRSDATIPMQPRATIASASTFTDPDSEDHAAIVRSHMFESRHRRVKFRTRLAETLQQYDELNRQLKSLKAP